MIWAWSVECILTFFSRKNARGVGCFSDSKPPKSVDGYHYSVAAFSRCRTAQCVAVHWSDGILEKKSPRCYRPLKLWLNLWRDGAPEHNYYRFLCRFFKRLVESSSWSKCALFMLPFVVRTFFILTAISGSTGLPHSSRNLASLAALACTLSQGIFFFAICPSHSFVPLSTEFVCLSLKRLFASGTQTWSDFIPRHFLCGLESHLGSPCDLLSFAQKTFEVPANSSPDGCEQGRSSGSTGPQWLQLKEV